MGNRGSVLLTFLIMATVFVALLGVGTNLLVGGYKRTTSVAQRNQAYYLAEAGVEEALKELQGGCRAIQTTQPISFPPASPVGYYSYAVASDGSEAIITSQGVVSEKSVTLRVTIRCTSLGPTLPPLDMAVFANQSLELGGSANIEGNVGINSTNPGSISLSGNPRIFGTAYIGPGGDPNSVISYPSWQSLNYFIQGGAQVLDEERNYSLPPFPEFPEDLPQRGNLVISGGPSNDVTISEDGYYDKIRILSNRTLTIQVGEGGVRVIRVKDLDIQQGHIVIEGQGKVIFYVENSFNLQGSSRVNENGNMDTLTLFYGGSESVNFSGDTRLVGTFYAQHANLTLGGSGGVVGLIVTGGDRVVVQGDASAYVRTLYAPQATVEMQGSGKLKGTIIADRFEAQGAASVIYAVPPQEFIDAFYGLFGNTGSQETPTPAPQSITEWKES